MSLSGKKRFTRANYHRTPSRLQDKRFLVRMAVYVVVLAIWGAYWFVAPHFIPESVAYGTAKGLGYSDIEVTKREFLFVQFTGCAKEDLVKFTVTGTNPAGDEQTFIVCAGLFKGGTPRFQ